MRYLGGKSRISKQIATVLNSATRERERERERESICKSVLWFMCH